MSMAGWVLVTNFGVYGNKPVWTKSTVTSPLTRYGNTTDIGSANPIAEVALENLRFNTINWRPHICLSLSNTCTTNQLQQQMSPHIVYNIIMTNMKISICVVKGKVLPLEARFSPDGG